VTLGECVVPYIVIRDIEASIDGRFVSNDAMGRDETRRDEMRCDDRRERARLAWCVSTERTNGA
jgi:hypothetical protein